MILKYFGEKYKKLYFNSHVKTFLSKKIFNSEDNIFPYSIIRQKKFVYHCEIILNILIAKHVHKGGGYVIVQEHFTVMCFCYLS